MQTSFRYWLFAPLLAVAVAPALAPAPVGVDAFPKPARPVAGIVSPIWHTEDERDRANEVSQVARLLGIEPGMTVADIGAGSGYYVMRLSPMLGPAGRIIAEDITPAYLRSLEGTVRRAGLGNVTVKRGEPADPKLAPRSIDRAILIHMYHEVAQPFALMHRLAAALKPGAQIGIVDAMRPTEEHGTPPALLRCELEAVGYREKAFHKLDGSEAYLAIFELPPDSEPTPPSRIVPCAG
jgi:predicted methyltransferase